MQPTARPIAITLMVMSLLARGSIAQDHSATAEAQARAIARVSADSLRGHLSFLASDLLEGRDSPSKGLDLAAEYVAAQFRRAGLEPVGDDGYFQTANWELSEPDPATFRLFVTTDGNSEIIRSSMVSAKWLNGHDVAGAGLIKVDFRRSAELKAEDVEGKVVLVEFPRQPSRAMRDFQIKMVALKPAVVIALDRDVKRVEGFEPVLFDPQSPLDSERSADAPGSATSLTVHDPKLAALFDAIPFGPSTKLVTLHLDPPARRAVKLRNVVGVLRGSDPALKETYVMVTAHYDHIGVRGPEGTDRIFNGANDDGSGTVSVVELAGALGTLEARPKRSLVFMTFFGEEHGLLGSRYYGRHPIFPIEKTIADVNLEQVGRTDDREGPRVGKAVLTGFGYSDVSTAFVNAGKLEGVEVLRHPTNSDAFFGRSDNQALADLGVPAHTLCVAFEFPDYHGAADHWDKLDYINMAKVDRMVARALITIADDPAEPRWNESNPRAAKYLKAWKERRAR